MFVLKSNNPNGAKGAIIVKNLMEIVLGIQELTQIVGGPITISLQEPASGIPGDVLLDETRLENG